jgi:deazaflavin-dependent oxidoreductase (nitroreductase family)
MPPTGMRRALFRAPIWLYRWHLGRLLGHRFLLIEHVGRVSGKQRRAVVEVVRIKGGSITVASGFGPRSDWYLNVLASPRITVQLGSRRMAVLARPLSPEDAGTAMADYAGRHPSAAAALCRYMGMTVDGSPDDFEEAGRRIHMLALDQEPPAAS